MHFTKPSWVMHKDSAKSDENAKRLSIFSVHVHPDGSRIATGGLDAKIRIWSTKPILNAASEASNKPPKSLCTLTMHTGPVLVVRWAHSGRWLASGSDDEIVMIWDLDPNARGKVWGSDEVNIEGWKPLKRLPGHESDVTDVAWAPQDRYLASVGLDSQVLIWCGYTLGEHEMLVRLLTGFNHVPERLRKLDQHQGFVKGVCWDPVGEFLATQSDDRSVKIWRTTDWGLEAEVTKPFEDSPGSTFFRRLSWSPDGAHITASNATNNKGFVFIAAVITRNSWASEISLVGHENTVEVAAYNPHIFLRNANDKVSTSNICSVVALGADDRSVSVWQTKSARPLIVAKEVFDRQIMDLSWSWDGMTLYAASSDGTIAAFNFEPDELEGIAPHSVQEQYLTKFGFSPAPVPEGYSHVSTKEPPSSSSQQQQSDFNQVNGGGDHVNVLVAKRSKKKRANLTTQVGAVPSAGTSISVNGMAGSSRNSAPLSKRTQALSSFPPPSEQPFDAPDSWSRHADMSMDVDVPIDSLDTPTSPIHVRSGKRKADFPDEGKHVKARTLGGDQGRDQVAAREIPVKERQPTLGAVFGEQESPLIPQRALMTWQTVEIEGTDTVLECTNPADGGPTVLKFVGGSQIQWLDYLSSPALILQGTSSFCAAALLDGSVVVYSHTGRRIMPTLTLGAPAAYMEANRDALLVITTSTLLYAWNIKKQTAFFPPTPIAPLILSAQSNPKPPPCAVASVAIQPNGSPVISLSNGTFFSYDPALLSWVKLSERWWSEGSDAWPNRQRMSTIQAGNRGIMSSIEGSVTGTPDESTSDVNRPAWWNTALTLGHLETRLNATKLLDSPQEYKQALLAYAKKISEEGFRGKAEELIKELFGPVYYRPGRDDSWTPNVVGLSKRDLLKEVLLVFARSKTLTKLAMDWQDTLKRASSDE
ncbi:hypothetical protein H0H92_003624 [Tricholoma furcatifolium]|nr:hypothetical protein H0H92_003624 [Tricholoma furcatifolium]